jgi:hypothetical protein
MTGGSTCFPIGCEGVGGGGGVHGGWGGRGVERMYKTCVEEEDR